MSGIAARTAKKQDKTGMLRRSLEKLIKLYTDNAHFLYELLQNAEDAEATHIKFVQFEDRLEVYHNGKPFTEANFNSLCDVGLSEKANDLNKIGEFGIGFKSVYSICKTVKLHSSPENYSHIYPDAEPAFSARIDNFTDPTDLKHTPVDSPYTTRFVFFYAVGEPFSGFDSIHKLKRKISERLQDLGVTTLLFMKHLEEIAYEINLNGKQLNGEYLLEKKEINDHCSLVSALGKSTTGNKSDAVEISYLKFSRRLNIDSSRTIDIAFPVIRIGENHFTCVKAKSPYISVYFPTETESKLDFIVQGPYRTTPNRSSIPADDSDNIILAQETSILLIDALKEMQRKKWLNMSFIKALPLNEAAFDNFALFKPLYIAVKELFNNNAIPIIPCESDGYVSARYAKIARNEKLLTLIDNNLLTDLIRQGANFRWLPSCVKETNSEYSHVYKYFVHELKIEVIRPDDLKGYIDNNPFFLPQRTDSWLVQLYTVLENVNSAFAQNKIEDNFLTSKIIKTSTGEFIAPYRITENKQYVPNVYLPSNEVNNPDITFVNERIYLQCRNFFETVLGLHQPDEYKFFISDITTRYSNNYVYDENQHIKDIKRLHKYLCIPKYQEDTENIIKDIFLLRCEDGKMRNPHSEEKRNTLIYLPKNNGIDIRGYFQNIVKNVLYVDLDFYSSHDIDASVLIAMGANGSLLEGENDIEGEYVISGKRKNTKWECLSGFRWKFDIVHVKRALLSIANYPYEKDSIIKSKTIFSILMKNEEKLCGTLRIQKRSIDNKENEPCELVRHLRGDWKEGWSGQWLYDKSMALVAQKDISRHDLNPDIYGKPQSSGVYDLLGFKRSAADDAADLRSIATSKQLEAYFEEELQKRYNMSSSMLSDKLKMLEESNAKQPEEHTLPDFPSVRVKNWDAIQRHAKQTLLYASPVKYINLIRSIRESKSYEPIRAYLKSMYQYDSIPEYACQICHKPTIDITVSQVFDKMETEIDEYHLCLCPACARRYKLMINIPHTMNKVRQKIYTLERVAIDSSDPVKIAVDDIEIWFTQTHIAEIKEILHLEARDKK